MLQEAGDGRVREQAGEGLAQASVRPAAEAVQAAGLPRVGQVAIGKVTRGRVERGGEAVAEHRSDEDVGALINCCQRAGPSCDCQSPT